MKKWATIRSDHRVIKPSDIVLTGSDLEGMLTWSKTIKPDKALHSRRIFVDSCCFYTALEVDSRRLDTSPDSGRL